MVFLFYIGFLKVSIVDVVDVLLVSYLMYQVYKLLRGSVAVKILLGILFIYSIYLIVRAVGLNLLSTILGQFLGVGMIAALILFQPEIRKFLLIIGKSTVFNSEGRFWNLPWKKGRMKLRIDTNAIIEAAKTLSGSNTGALIVFAKSSELKFYAESGDEINAVLSKRLLISIFNKNSPLHDGAVIVSVTGRIIAARCILPVSDNDRIPPHMGLRHRAAIGITEVTDAIVLVVSEETGQISLVKNGAVEQDLPIQELRSRLNRFLSESDESEMEAVLQVKDTTITN